MATDWVGFQPLGKLPRFPCEVASWYKVECWCGRTLEELDHPQKKNKLYAIFYHQRCPLCGHWFPWGFVLPRRTKDGTWTRTGIVVCFGCKRIVGEF